MLLISENVSLMKLTGVGVTTPEGCYSEEEGLLVLDGANVTVSDCVLACTVSRTNFRFAFCVKVFSTVNSCMITVCTITGEL